MDSVWILVVAVALGVLLGIWLPIGEKVGRWCSRVLLVLLFALIFIMGVKIGATESVFSYLPELGMQAALFAAAGIALSVVLTKLLEKLIRYKAPDVAVDTVMEDKPARRVPMSVRIVLDMLAGVLAGRFLPLGNAAQWLDPLVFYGLCVMVFVVGLDIGRSRDSFTYLKAHGYGILITPVGTIVGSVAAGLAVGALLGYGVVWGGAIGSGLGWYTFSGVALARIDTRLGALAFLTNLFREVFAMICIPPIAKRWGPLAAIAPAGGTSMDTTLPIIVRCTSASNAVVSFINGVVCSLSIPPLIGFFMQFSG